MTVREMKPEHLPVSFILEEYDPDKTSIPRQRRFTIEWNGFGGFRVWIDSDAEGHFNCPAVQVEAQKEGLRVWLYNVGEEEGRAVLLPW